MFLYSRSVEASNDTYRGRANRTQLPFRATADQITRIDLCVAESKFQSRMEFICAAVLWFDGLEKASQIDVILATIAAKKCENPKCTVPTAIGKIVRKWTFPLHSIGQVVAAATVKFCDLPAEEKSEFIRRVIINLSN